ncbi:enoyl-CoA hydratase/isomerase family protein [Actinomadura roseirufa]|uniref:enoyl-CoA hydratase/isomerase family protein n=1 Tax=Actinomadura roseirufa TaxID=2094049 RepID=UPI0010410BAF|nr:enoyl-CoA hydratase/isomerase family protein [Actinomadura roseirufa]
MSARVTFADGVGVVTMDWPRQRNALGPAEGEELLAALTRADQADEAAVVVLTGNGAFCAGGNLPAILEVVEQGPDAVRDLLYDTFHRVVRLLVRTPKPVLAAIDGPAVGLGMDLALACDWRAIGPRGWLRQGWGTLGVIPGIGGELLLRRLAPGLLWSVLASPGRITPAEAARLGLAVEHPESALDAALQRAAELAALPRDTLEGYARLHRESLRDALDGHLRQCLEIQTRLLCAPEFRRRAAEALAGNGAAGDRAPDERTT